MSKNQVLELDSGLKYVKNQDINKPDFIYLESGSESALSSPLTGTFVFDYNKISEKIANCGLEFDEYFPPDGAGSKVLPIFCDNRICSNPDCNEHRLYKYMKAHGEQVKTLNKSMKKPKAWVFSGWVLPFDKISRRFIQDKLIFLFCLLKSFSVSEFSVHMELKVYPLGHKNYGKFYIHFHVVSGGFRDLRFIRKRWNRQLRYETAIRSNELGFYISKYASKTPRFPDDICKYHYARLVYKLQMHRFSTGTAVYVASGWVSLSQIEREVYNALYKDSYLNPYSSKKHYFGFLEGKPPPVRYVNLRKDPVLNRLQEACDKQRERYLHG